MKSDAVAQIRLDVPLAFRRGSFRANQELSILSGMRLIELVANLVRNADGRALGDVTWLDHGCGVKIVQALIQQNIAIKRYIGLDVYKDMIEWLKTNVSDPRFQFHAVDYKNAMYNKKGQQMRLSDSLPVADKADLMTMFSVVTHLAPGDARATLTSLRNQAADGSHLVFSCFIGQGQTEKFIDAVPDRPLLQATYSEAFIRRIIASAGWKAVSLSPPIPEVIQHNFYCVPG